MATPLTVIKLHYKLQGDNEVCFSIAVPISVPKFMILDSKKAWQILVPDPTKMVQPDPSKNC